MVNDSVRKGEKHKERRGKVEEKAKEKQRGSGTRDDRQGRLYRLFAVKSVVSFHASPPFPPPREKLPHSLEKLSPDKDTSLYAARAKLSPRRASNTATTSFQEKEPGTPPLFYPSPCINVFFYELAISRGGVLEKSIPRVFLLHSRGKFIGCNASSLLLFTRL